MKYYLIVLLAVLFQSCSSSTKTDKEVNAPELVLVDSYMFRRAYHGHDTLQGKEYDVFMNRNPEGSSDHSNSKEHPLYKDLVRNKIIEDGNLNLSQIDTLPEQFEYQVSPKRRLQVEFQLLEDPEVVDAPSYILTFKEKNKTILIDTLAFGFPPDVTFLTRDLNSDGKEELLAIFQWYIVNGDNYDLTIYELKE